MTPLLAVKKLVKIPFQDFCHLDDRATRSENTPVLARSKDFMLASNRFLTQYHNRTNAVTVAES